MSGITLDTEWLSEMFRHILQSAGPLAQLHVVQECCGSSGVLSLILELCESLCAGASEYYRVLQADLARAASLLELLVQEDVQIGEVIENEGGVSDPA